MQLHHVVVEKVSQFGERNEWLEERIGKNMVSMVLKNNLMDNEEERLAFYQSLNNGVGEIVGQSDQVRRVNSVPQIFIDDKRIGGYDELMKMSTTLLKKRTGGLLKFSETYKPFHYPWAC